MSSSTPSDRSRDRRNVLISVVVPAYNEEDNLPALFDALKEVFEAEGCTFELVVAENGSADGSLDVLKRMTAEDPRIQYVSLSRNFGSQGGLIAGLEYCRGDVVITMDADLQHPPAKIPDFLEAWEQGHDVVMSQRENKEFVSWWRRRLNAAYYAMMQVTTGIPLNKGQSDFRLMDRIALDALLALPEHQKFLRCLAFWIGFRQTTILYSAQDRHSGETKYRFMDLIRFTMAGLTSFSSFPLHVFTAIGLVVSAGSMLYGLAIAVIWAFGLQATMPSGWASLGVGVFFLGGVQLIGIGVLGEYLSKVFDETRGRPAYIVRERSAELDGKGHADDGA